MIEIRALREGDDRTQFQSGDPDLDRFFKRFAGQNPFRHYVGVTYVAVEDRRVLGFATVAPGHVEIDGLPSAARRKLPRYPLPVLRLARLAVDRPAQGEGLGAQLLRFVLGLALRMADDYGCVGVIVDAKPDAVSFYAKYGFIPVEAIEGQADARPQQTPVFLGTRAIALGAGAQDEAGAWRQCAMLRERPKCLGGRWKSGDVEPKVRRGPSRGREPSLHNPGPLLASSRAGWR